MLIINLKYIYFVFGGCMVLEQWLRCAGAVSCDHSKHPLPTTQKTLYMDITRWSTLKSD